MTTALVMAGGRGERMRASGVTTAKPLVAVGGRTLLERNLLALLDRRDPDLLVVFADNLTTLDLAAIVGHHRKARAALTTAVHFEPFRIPFGEVEVRDGWVVSYTEKPEHRVLVSSGVLVLGPAAIARIPRGRPTGISWLANQLLAAGERIAAFPHQASWIDVNDMGAAERAEHALPDAGA